jgi:hypothetical protein
MNRVTRALYLALPLMLLERKLQSQVSDRQLAAKDGAALQNLSASAEIKDSERAKKSVAAVSNLVDALERAFNRTSRQQ